MSKLYDNYLFLKANDSQANHTLYLFKSGLFFIFLDNDAIIASKLLGLRLTYLTEGVVKCGFPSNSFEKYSTILKRSSYHLKIVDSVKNRTCSLDTYTIDESIKSLLQEIATIDTNTLSVKEAYDFIERLKSSTKFMI